MLPLYEAKMFHQNDHRYGTYLDQTEAQANVGTLPRLTPHQKNDPSFNIFPRYWVNETEISKRLGSRKDRGWFLVWRNISRTNDERTMILTQMPTMGVGNSGTVVLSARSDYWILASAFNSFVFDYILRQKMSGPNLNYFVIKQLPSLPPVEYAKVAPWALEASVGDWIRDRAIELCYTTYEMERFAQDLGMGGPPYRWDEVRRGLLRTELDAVYFYLYGIERADVDYIMETFPIVKRKDEAAFGEYRTKRLILEIYDAIAEAVRTGKPYQTALDPPPGQGPRHPARDG
jgi:hypothetical protein